MTLLLHNIGPKVNSNYNTLEEILTSTEPLSFDGVYRNVFENWEALRGKDITLFVMGDYIGKDNSFDVGQPREKLCTLLEILKLEKQGAKLGWHTWSHRDLTTLSEEEIRNELSCPWVFRKRLAYPYGKFDERVIRIAQEMGYEEGWSVTEGDNSQFQKLRKYL